MNDRGSSTGEAERKWLESLTSIRALLSTALAELPGHQCTCGPTASLLEQAQFEVMRLTVNLERAAQGRGSLQVSTTPSPTLPDV